MLLPGKASESFGRRAVSKFHRSRLRGVAAHLATA